MEQPSPFQEKSGFPTWIFWSILSIPTALYLFILSTNLTDVEPLDCIGLIIVGLVGLLIYSIKLKITIDSKGITFSYPPFRKKPIVLYWEEIESVKLLKINPLKEFGGWGLRYGKLGVAYTTRGKYILHIKTQQKTPINLTVVNILLLTKKINKNQWPILHEPLTNKQ